MLSNLNGPVPTSLNKLWVTGATALILIVTGLMLLTIVTLGHMLVGIANLMLGVWFAYAFYQALSVIPMNGPRG